MFVGELWLAGFVGDAGAFEFGIGSGRNVGSRSRFRFPLRYSLTVDAPPPASSIVHADAKE